VGTTPIFYPKYHLSFPLYSPSHLTIFNPLSSSLFLPCIFQQKYGGCPYIFLLGGTSENPTAGGINCLQPNPLHPNKADQVSREEKQKPQGEVTHKEKGRKELLQYGEQKNDASQ